MLLVYLQMAPQFTAQSYYKKCWFHKYSAYEQERSTSKSQQWHILFKLNKIYIKIVLESYKK